MSTKIESCEHCHDTGFYYDHTTKLWIRGCPHCGQRAEEGETMDDKHPIPKLPPQDKALVDATKDRNYQNIVLTLERDEAREALESREAQLQKKTVLLELISKENEEMSAELHQRGLKLEALQEQLEGKKEDPAHQQAEARTAFEEIRKFVDLREDLLCTTSASPATVVEEEALRHIKELLKIARAQQTTISVMSHEFQKLREKKTKDPINPKIEALESRVTALEMGLSKQEVPNVPEEQEASARHSMRCTACGFTVRNAPKTLRACVHCGSTKVLQAEDCTEDMTATCAHFARKCDSCCHQHLGFGRFDHYQPQKEEPSE